MARPRTPVGAYGSIAVRCRGNRVIAETRIRDADGRIRHVRVTARTAAQARLVLKERLLNRPSFGGTRVLTPQSSFPGLSEVWLADLDLQPLAEGTKQNYRDQVRLHVLPAFEHYALAEITTGRVEWFLKSQAAISSSRARQSRTLLNLLFAFALRHDAVSRNPVAGTSPLRHPKSQPKALTLEQIGAIRVAATNWRNEPGLPGPKPDGQVRDIIEVLLGTAMRTGEVLALRPCDVDDRPTGMVVAVTGTVVQRRGHGAIRQDRPKSEASIRWIPVPEFAAVVLRRRLAGAGDTRTIFANRTGGPSAPTTSGARSGAFSSRHGSRAPGSVSAGTGAQVPRSSPEEWEATRPHPSSATHRRRSPRVTTSNGTRASIRRQRPTWSGLSVRWNPMVRCSRRRQ
jgi:integrase